MHRELTRLELGEFVIRELVYSPGTRMTRHAHDYSNVTVVIAGEIDEGAEGGRYRGTPGSVLLKPAGCEHENGVSGIGVRTLSIELRRGALAAELGQRRWTWFEHATVVRAAMAFCRAGLEDAESHAAALLATVLSAPQCNTAAPGWLAQVIAALEERFDEPLRLEGLARDLGLHPVYVSRAFHQHVGVTMHDYLRTLRLRHARQLLGASKRSITAIASLTGFSDPSHLSRTFSEQLGMTPRSFRNFSRPVPLEVQGVQIALAEAS